MRGIWAVGLLAAARLAAQSVEIYSEFQRLDPFGKIVAADASPHPREVLSPAVARNAFASFHVVVSVPSQSSYLLYVVTNPLDACRVALYREHFVKTAGGWIPDRLTELRRLPDFGAMPDPDDGVPGQNTRVYLLDLWIPPGEKPGGFRLEVQLRVGYWIVRPMEVRILTARVPELEAVPETSAPMPAVEQGVDAAALDPLDAYVAGRAQRTYATPRTVREVIRRNAVQDMALAGMLNPARAGPEAIAKRRAELPWKKEPGRTRTSGAEWYLRIRDLLMAEGQCVSW